MIKDEWIIFETLAGSHLYGTNTPESDIDIRGICIIPIEELIDPFSKFEQQEYLGEDKVIFELRKFFQLAVDCNPNIIELLFVNREAIITYTPAWNYLYNNRHLFLSERIRATFAGYAQQQLARIKRHRKWITNPPDKKPERKDFKLPEMPHYSFEKLQALLAAPIDVIIPEMRAYAIQEMKYREAKIYWDNYSTWATTRNPARFDLENSYGYDTKHAMHLFRLYSEALELLSTGELVFPRPDKDFLLEIKNGKLTYDEVVQLGDEFKNRIDSVETVLPAKPNLKRLKYVYLALAENYYDQL